MDHADWESRWKQGRIAFHQPSVSDFLEKHFDQVFGTEPGGRIYVPLCGKSLDMVFLAERSEEVLGVEYVEQGVREFFAERGLEPEIEPDPTTYRAANYTLFAADFFSVGKQDLGHLDGAYDRAALIALDQPTRVRYVDHLRALLAPGSKILLLTLDYDQSEMSGPPFAVADDEVASLYEDGFTVERLESRDAIIEQFRARGVSKMRESAFAITRR